MESNKGPTRWGILSVGRISNDFVTALRILPQTEHKIMAVAARSWESAQEFSRKNNIPKFCKNYEELIKYPEVEVVYIGSINPHHFPLAKLAISNGKHVLCEKPLCINVKETVALVALAREKGVFLMEVYVL
jgi:dihydrodiol dehydrogenase / D-xylose 1-dehydrogenase (NADP)